MRWGTSGQLSRMRCRQPGWVGSGAPVRLREVVDEAERGLRAADRAWALRRQHVLQEAVPLGELGVSRGARRIPPVGDVAPTGGRERSAELLHGEGRAERRELEALLERPVAQRAEHEGCAEHVPGAGRVERADGHGGNPDLLPRRGVDADRAVLAAGHDDDGHVLGEGAGRGEGRAGARVLDGLPLVRHERVAGRQGLEHGSVPHTRVVPAHVGEDPGAVGRRAQPPRLLLEARHGAELGERGAARDAVAEERVARDGARVPVRDHAAVAVLRHGDRDRGMPVLEAPRTAEVDALVLLQQLPAPAPVDIVAEDGGERGGEPEAAGRDGEVGDAARRRPHALCPDLRARARRAVEVGEDDVEEDGAREDHIESRTIDRVGRGCVVMGRSHRGSSR